jgi:uncharacterized protein (TIGR01370 family)
MDMIYIYTALIVLTLSACSKDDNTSPDNTAPGSTSPDSIIVKPTGSSKAIPVYNHAYNENHDSDQIDYIILNANNAYVLIDPFQDNVSESVQAIKANGNEVGAYISIGTGENWRDDFDSLQPYLVPLQWAEWEGEYFINEASTSVVDVMKARIDQIAAWGCDWVEFDNMDWVSDYSREEYGVQMSREESIAYFQEMCDYVHQKGLKCMAKNTVEGAENFDGVTYESYNNNKNWWDNSGAQSFLNADKIVLIIHYNESNCDQVYSDYMETYNNDLSFLCESSILQKFIHYND